MKVKRTSVFSNLRKTPDEPQYTRTSTVFLRTSGRSSGNVLKSCNQRSSSSRQVNNNTDTPVSCRQKTDCLGLEEKSFDDFYVIDKPTNTGGNNNAMTSDADNEEFQFEIDCATPTKDNEVFLAQPEASSRKRGASKKSRRLSNLSTKFQNRIQEIACKNSSKGVTPARHTPILTGNEDTLSKLLSNKHLKTKEVLTTAVVNFRTPEKRSAAASDFFDSDEEATNKLESNIIVDDSPIRISKTSKRKRSRVAQKDAQNAHDSNSPSIEHLSELISDGTSTQSSVASQCVSTPMAVWVLKDKKDKHDSNGDIVQFDSPSKPMHTESTFENTSAKQRGMQTLVESFKSIKARYDSSVHLLGHELRLGKYDENTSLTLIIRKVIERQEKLFKTIVYDLNERQNRWIIFKPINVYDIVEGACLKLYRPWQEISIPGTLDTIIIAADFYKIFRKAEINLTEQHISDINELPLPQFSLPSISGVTEPLFRDIVPYRLKNKSTMLKQIQHFSSRINIDVLVLDSWTYSSAVMALIKDSDNFISVLEACKSLEGTSPVLTAGSYLKLNQVAVAKRVTASERLALFSLLHMYGTKQIYCYILQWDSESKFEIRTVLDIPMIKSPLQQVLSLSEIIKVPSSVDFRVCLECFLKSMENNSMMVADESNKTLRIDFIFDSNYSIIGKIPFWTDGMVRVKFLRLIHGKAIWDEFTICEEVMETEADDI